MSDDSKVRERHMIVAHRHGCERARDAFRAAIETAEMLYPGKAHAQFSYLAGFAAEVRRIAAQQQNRGLRVKAK